MCNPLRFHRRWRGLRWCHIPPPWICYERWRNGRGFHQNHCFSMFRYLHIRKVWDCLPSQFCIPVIRWTAPGWVQCDSRRASEEKKNRCSWLRNNHWSSNLSRCQTGREWKHRHNKRHSLALPKMELLKLRLAIVRRRLTEATRWPQPYSLVYWVFQR